MRRNLWVTIVTFSTTLCAKSADQAHSVTTPSMKKLFSAPLITGASVSANWNSDSPGRKVALRYTELKNIETIAQGGTPGRVTIERLSEAKFANRSIVIAMDFLFWDSTDRDQSKSVAALDRLIKLSEATKVPLVLGDIPELLPGRQSLRPSLNKKIHSACRASSFCVVWELDALHQQIMRDGYLTIGNKKRTIRELVPDGLHLSQEAGDFLANELEKLAQKF